MIRKIGIALLVLSALVWGGWLLALPADLIERQAEQSLSEGNVQVDIVGLRKGVFYNFGSDALDVRVSGRRVFSVEGLSCRLNVPASVIGLSAVLDLKGRSGGGAFSGRVTLSGRVKAGKENFKADFSLDGADIGRMGMFEQTGLKGSGKLDTDVKLRDRGGSATFTVTDARLGTLDYRGTAIPLDMFQTIRGYVEFVPGMLSIKSLTLEGGGGYAKASGAITGNMLDARLELMPDSGALPDYLVSALIGHYRVSPGHYVIPVRQKLDF